MNSIPGRRLVLILGGVALAIGLIAFLSISNFYETVRRRAAEQERWPKVKQMKGGEMVLVPAGVFLAGSRKEPVNTPAFYIDRNRVSREAFLEFSAATGRRPTETSPSADEARAFCSWAGKRLPYSVEWEKAARLNAVSGLYGNGWEWIEDSQKAGHEDIERFSERHRMSPPLKPGEKWGRVRGGTQDADSSMFPARYSAADISFRCVYLPPQ